MDLRENQQPVVTLQNVLNPEIPGVALWTLSTFVRPVAPSTLWMHPDSRRDLLEDFVGPQTCNRITMNREMTTLASPFFDTAASELLVAFHVHPEEVPAGQYLLLYAPFGYTFLDRTFTPGNGFPMTSCIVYVREPQSNAAQWAYVVQILTRIRADQIVHFRVRVSTPRTPEDLGVWEADHSRSWRLLVANDANGLEPTSSNDNHFPGFGLQASFGAVSIVPEPNGVTPLKRVSVILSINPQSTLQSLLEDGSIHVRVIAPLGFDFDPNCLAVTPNPTFSLCDGNGRMAVLLVRGGVLAACPSSVRLSLTNAGTTPVSNSWALASFLDTPRGDIPTATDGGRQTSITEGYTIRRLMEATIGAANTQRDAVTTVLVWFLAARFLDVGGVLELHAPRSYELRCSPRVQYITLPAGSCQLNSGVVSSSGDHQHDYLALTLTLSNRLIYPNTAYEFGVSAANPSTAPEPSFWGLILRNTRGEVEDASMTVEGYRLTDFVFLVHALLASSTFPAVVNYVRIAFTFERELAAGIVGHLTIRAPSTTRVLCTRFEEITAGGSSVASLPLDPSQGVYGTHSCQLQNTITLHVSQSQPLLVGTHVLRIGVLNPGIRATRDFWAVELLPGEVRVATGGNATSDWRTVQAILQVTVKGFGVTSPFSGPTLLPIPVNAARRFSILGFASILLPALLWRAYCHRIVTSTGL